MRARVWRRNPYVLARQQVERAAPPGSVDCIPYDPAGLRLTDEGGGKWMLERADGATFRALANRPDAEAGLAVFKEHSSLCYIGRGNSMPPPYRSQYVMEYLE